MMTTTINRVRFGPNGYWLCSCGHTMLYLAQPEAGPRPMSCTNRECKHFDVPYQEPSFKAEKA